MLKRALLPAWKARNFPQTSQIQSSENKSARKKKSNIRDAVLLRNKCFQTTSRRVYISGQFSFYRVYQPEGFI
jgi:hypothetical protein